MRVAIYVRISLDRTGAGLGVERQEEDCRELAQRQGWTVVEVFSDNDISAYSGRRRPAYEQLLAAVEAGEVDAVVAWHTDRLHRSPAELERYIAVCDARGVPTATVRSGTLDLTTATGRMTARVVGAVSRMESEQKSERLRSQRKQVMANGGWIGGRRPFGYEADGMTVHPVEGPAVADAIRRALAGESMRSIAREWNDRGLLTTTGATWYGANLIQVLMRPRNAGLVGNRRQVLGVARWEPLIDRDTWEAFRAMVTDPSRLSHRGNTSIKLLGSYLFRCARCDQPMRSGGIGARGQSRYTCLSFHSRRASEPIDDYVRAAVVEILNRDGAGLIQQAKELSVERDRLAVLRARADELAVQWVDLGMTADQFKAANGRINSEAAELVRVLAQATAGSVLAGVADADDPGAAFAALDIDRQRAVIDALMEVRIVPAPAGRKGFYPDSVVITTK